jgi:hypothetical protein
VKYKGSFALRVSDYFYAFPDEYQIFEHLHRLPEGQRSLYKLPGVKRQMPKLNILSPSRLPLMWLLIGGSRFSATISVNSKPGLSWFSPPRVLPPNTTPPIPLA